MFILYTVCLSYTAQNVMNAFYIIGCCLFISLEKVEDESVKYKNIEKVSPS